MNKLWYFVVYISDQSYYQILFLIKQRKMIAVKTFNIIHSKIFGVLTVLLIFLFSSCAQKSEFLRSSVVPAAHGTVKVKKDKNLNYNIDIAIEDLAEVEKVFSGNYSYIVWMENEDGETDKLGKLVSSTGFLSDKRKAKLETISTSEPRQIFVTAERNQNAIAPGNNLILRTRKF